MNPDEQLQLVKAKPEDLSTIRELLKSCNLPGDDLTEEHFSIRFYTTLGGFVLKFQNFRW